jgi:hypothetical protein
MAGRLSQIFQLNLFSQTMVSDYKRFLIICKEEKRAELENQAVLIRLEGEAIFHILNFRMTPWFDSKMPIMAGK